MITAIILMASWFVIGYTSAMIVVSGRIRKTIDETGKRVDVMQGVEKRWNTLPDKEKFEAMEKLSTISSRIEATKEIGNFGKGFLKSLLP